jgi:hypothetical protein
MVAESNPPGQRRKPPATDMKDGKEHTTIRITEGRSPVCAADAVPFLIGVNGTCLKSSREAILAVLERALKTLEPFQVLTNSVVISIGDERHRPAAALEGTLRDEGGEEPEPDEGELWYLGTCTRCEQDRAFRLEQDRDDWVRSHRVSSGHYAKIRTERRVLAPKQERPAYPPVIWDASGNEWRLSEGVPGHYAVGPSDGDPWPSERIDRSFGPVTSTRPEVVHSNWIPDGR